MSLQSKARSLEKLWDDYSLIESDNDNRIALEKEYVPLEEAQKDKADAINKLEEEKNRAYAELEFAMAKAVKAEAERYGELYNKFEAADKYRINETEKVISLKKELKKIEYQNLEKQNRILNALKILEEIPEPVGAKLPSINDLQIVYHQEELRQWRIRLHDALQCLSFNHKEKITEDKI